MPGLESAAAPLEVSDFKALDAAKAALRPKLSTAQSFPTVLHSLRFLDVAVSEPGPGIPQFMEMGYVDGIPITRYDSERGRAEPLTPWMAAGAEPGYWDRETQRNEGTQLIETTNLEIARGRYNHSRGLHTWQTLSGCDLLSDGSVRGSYQYSYDGQDFISFELGSRSFV
ncbi:major histocompatibility complex class I-related gene protein-like, partial [Neopelma chrysocephalum]|uniref:major histocompatibility complex class I-related gene protein-like n=1 Tax=Neopelma chrysocephalum TaxID=114329 RepID=UPI000FCD07DA